MNKPSHPLRTWRKSHEVTLHDLAGRIGVTGSHLSEIENWKNTPSLELAARLQDHTGIDMKDFVRREHAEAHQ